MDIDIKALAEAHPIRRACGQSFLLRDGISVFTANPSYCPDGVPRPWIQDLVRKARDLGLDQAWWEASHALRPEEMDTLEQAVGVEGREGWQYLVSLSPEAVALDLGSGWGPFSCGLAEKVAQVYIIDPSVERLQLLRMRAEQRSLHNLHYLQGGNALPLPFPDHFFDLVKVGALERIACLIAGNPRRVQRQLLQEIRRVLKPAGQVYAEVENRFALKFFKGIPQEGSSPSYVTLMPRLLAHLYCLLTRGRTYRTYTYSATGTERLFRQAGFDTVQTLLLYPNRRKFDRVLAPGDAIQLASFYTPLSAWKGLGKRLLARVGGLSWLAPAFGLVTSPEPDGHHFLEQIVSLMGRNQQARYEIVETHLRDYGGCVLFLQDRNEPAHNAVLKLALDQGGENALGRAARNLVQMAETLKRGRPLMPRILESGIAQGHSYVLEERLPGCNGWQMMDRGWSAGQLADIVWDFLEGWTRAFHSTVCLTEEEFSRWVPYQPEQWRRLVGPQAARALGELILALRDYMVGRERVVVASHGDFSLGNVLFHEATGAIEGIVDWDSADLRGLPLVDAISLSQYRDEPATKVVRDLVAEPAAERRATFDMGFPDGFAEEHTVSTLAETLRRVCTCPDHPRLARIRSEFGYETDRDAYMALFLFFLKRHQPGSLALRKQTRKWVEGFRLVLYQRSKEC